MVMFTENPLIVEVVLPCIDGLNKIVIQPDFRFYVTTVIWQRLSMVSVLIKKEDRLGAEVMGN